MKTVTLLDVARAANVSKTTVSNVFSRPERVRAELRGRVEAAAAKLGYDGPDPKARLLNSGKVNAIGVVPPATGLSWVFSSPYMSDFLMGVAQVCEPRNVGLSLVYAGTGPWGVRNAVVDGFILSNVRQVDLIEPAVRRRLPFVVMDSDAGPDIRSVRLDDRKLYRDMTRHLTALGHRRIGFMSSGRDIVPPVFHAAKNRPHAMTMAYPSDLERLAGFADALAEVGVSVNQEPIVEGCGTDDEMRLYGKTSAGLLLDGAPDITAIVTSGTELTIQVLVEARKRGIDVPRQLSIIGIDNSDLTLRTDPPLTVAIEPALEKGRVAAEMLFDPGPPRQVVLPVKIDVRGSTAPPPATKTRRRKAG